MLGSKNKIGKKIILIIRLFYPSLHSNPRKPCIKAFIFSLLTFFGSLLALGYQKERERMSRPKEENFFMLNLIVEKGASKDCDRSRSNIIRPRTGTPTGFVQRSRLDFGLGISPYTLDIFFYFFSFIVVAFDRYYVAYKLITFSCILFMFIEMKFIHCYSCVMFVMKSMSMCND